MTPRIIGQWTLGSKIAQGGQAEVYEATSAEGGPICALKIVRTQSPQKRARFVQEVRKHLQLIANGVPNIVPILGHNLDAFEAGEPTGYIVMPKAETTLGEEKQLLARRPELCLEIFRGIASGIKEAHAIGIIHRDLKPANILFMDRSLRTPLVSDFGICFVKGTPDDERLTGVQETVGAKFFMAPEQERGGITDVQETADIYALGKLLHFMLTGRYLFRENLGEAFEPAEMNADPRLHLIREQILACTIVYEKDKRIQTAEELIQVIDRLREQFRGPMGGPAPGPGPSGPAPSRVPPASPPGEPLAGRIGETYRQVVAALDEGRVRGIKIHFDRCQQDFTTTWKELRASIERRPEQTPEAVRSLIRAQPDATGLTLAMTRVDAAEVFPDFKRLLELITRSSEGQAGYIAVHAVPHVQAGFLYMAASVAALHFQSWEILDLLLRSKFEWYYQSGRPLYSFGFEHSYFFHSEALGGKASESHNLFRVELSEPELLEMFGLNPEEMFNAYVQTHMVMCLRGAQELEVGEDVSMFADFGRFYEYRVIPLLDRAKNDPQFAGGLCKAFRERPDEWFGRLNARLEIVRSRFFGGGGFFWESVSSYEPR